MDEEQAWIERAKRGDEAAFAELVRRHQTRTYRICRAMLGDDREADEAAQDVFVRLYERLATFRGDSRLSTWLYRVTLNLCADRLRRRKWSWWIGLDGLNLAGRAQDQPDRQAEDRDEVRRLSQAMERLPREFRDVLALRELEGRPYAEIAEILGISIGTVESRLYRAKEKMRNELEVE
ncbi:sigma-70 family RNA polymerase sigma factor [bacterium]|nr:sigma-70 family RNA polymerase sigma factor [bacterium]